MEGKTFKSEEERFRYYLWKEEERKREEKDRRKKEEERKGAEFDSVQYFATGMLVMAEQALNAPCSPMLRERAAKEMATWFMDFPAPIQMYGMNLGASFIYHNMSYRRESE